MASVLDGGSYERGSACARLGGYVLGSRIASGELTVVEEAHRVADGDGVVRALKRLRARHPDHANFRRILTTTSRRMLGVSHPHLVRVVDAYDGDETFTVMEAVDGANLASLLLADPSPGRIPFVVTAVAQALEGLHALHELLASDGEPEGFVHCAPVARHLLIGADGITRVVDFTHMLGRNVSWATWCDERLDPADMAPEQALSPAHVDRRCDIFVAGIVLWESLTGRSLFRAATRSAAMDNMLRKPIVMPGEVNPSVPHEVSKICLRALRRSRSERFDSAAEFSHALRTEAERHELHASNEHLGAWAKSMAQRIRSIREGARECQRATACVPSVSGRALGAFQGSPSVAPSWHKTTLTFGWPSAGGMGPRQPALARSEARDAQADGEEASDSVVNEQREAWSTVAPSTIPSARSSRWLAWMAIGAAAPVAYLTLLAAHNSGERASTDLAKPGVERAAAREVPRALSGPASLAPNDPQAPEGVGAEDRGSIHYDEKPLATPNPDMPEHRAKAGARIPTKSMRPRPVRRGDDVPAGRQDRAARESMPPQGSSMGLPTNPYEDVEQEVP